MSEPKARSPEELTATFLAHLKTLAHYWRTVKLDDPDYDRFEGLIHSVLCVIDGVSGGFPCALELVCRVHPDDKAFHIGEGEDWIEDGTVLTDHGAMLHDQMYGAKT